MYRHLYICAAVLAIPPNAPTFAVEAQPVASGPAQSQSIATDQPQLDEIVVTAQRRAESAQNVPIAISALNGNQLASAGVSNTAALQTAVGRLSDAITAARKPGMPLATISAITREAPLASLFVAFLFGVAIARRR